MTMTTQLLVQQRQRGSSFSSGASSYMTRGRLSSIGGISNGNAVAGGGELSYAHII